MHPSGHNSKVFSFLIVVFVMLTTLPSYRILRRFRTLNLRKVFSTRVSYNHLQVEQKWQDYWDINDTFDTIRRNNFPKKYILDMFPYPSGEGLHVGHPLGYTATDILARYWRMKGYDVLHPMGWDAFGLPAEQHAINTGTHPVTTTIRNIETFKRQLKSLGFSYDWKREISTTDVNYFKWTQWLFLQFFKRGLALQSEVSVNWCPKLGTVLANEEIVEGVSERGGHPVVKLPLRQWILKITEYGDKLEKGLQEGLDWPEGTLSAQQKWIGKSSGASVQFQVDCSSELDRNISLDVFTTRPETLFGATYLVVAPEHPLIPALVAPAQRHAVEDYIAEVAQRSDIERTSNSKDKVKTGIFLGTFARHPMTNELIPIWVADYVLGSFGTGAVMGVPAHDARDYEFAQVFNLPIKRVIRSKDDSNQTLPFLDRGEMCGCGSAMDGIDSEEGRKVMVATLVNSRKGEEKTMYRLRDWVFSRQRYWGEPIPIYFPVEILTSDSSRFDPRCESTYRIRYDQPIAVAETDLPLKLPDMVDFSPTDDPQGCLARCVDWRFFQKDGQWFARETNTMPQWAGSCWYYLRFTDPHNNFSFIDTTTANSWLPVDIYVGGQEHAVLHLLYARFWHKFLYDQGLVTHDEPFIKLVHQGMILGSDGEKMSKSRGNVVNPDEIVQKYGADALRMYEMFMGPLEALKPWQTDQVQGVVRFLDKVWSVVGKFLENPEENISDEDMQRVLHKTIKKVSHDIESMAYNTVISTLMIYTNKLASNKQSNARDSIETLLLLLNPIAPHLTEECWELLGHKTCLAKSSWPLYDEKLCEDHNVQLAIQINGKTRHVIEISKDVSQDEAIEAVHNNVGNFNEKMKDKVIKKIVYVPGKILNFVI